MATLVAYPLVLSFWNTLHYYQLYRFEKEFVGVDNYLKLPSDDLFIKSLSVSVFLTGLEVSSELVIGFLLALLMNRELKGIRLMRTLITVPLIVSPVAIGLSWRFMYEPIIGIINYVLVGAGLPRFKWLSDIHVAPYAVAIVDIWQWTPFLFLMFLAGLHAIPREIEESAQLDGASTLNMLRHITIPTLMPIISIAILIRTIDAFKTFDTIFLLTRGGPATATYVLSIYAFEMGFFYWEMGYASTLAYFIMIVIVIFVTLYLKVTKFRL